MDVPVHSSVEITAFSADDDLGKAVVSGVDPLLTGRGAVDVSPPDEFFLDLHEKLFRNVSRFALIEFPVAHHLFSIPAIAIGWVHHFEGSVFKPLPGAPFYVL